MFNWVSPLTCLCRRAAPLLNPRGHSSSLPLLSNRAESRLHPRNWAASPLSPAKFLSLASPYDNHTCPCRPADIDRSSSQGVPARPKNQYDIPTLQPYLRPIQTIPSVFPVGSDKIVSSTCNRSSITLTVVSGG